jgi:uncharacterized protein (TIGR02271 family)
MATAQQRTTTVVGVFEDQHRADQAVAQLKRAGFREDQIGVAFRHNEGTTQTTSSEDVAHSSEHGTHTGTGAMTGVLTGLGLGALAGMGVLSGVIPVIGPAIAGGTLGIILSNAAAGAAAAGLAGALVGSGIPEHEADYYNNEFEAGRTIVTVHAGDRAAEASAILRQYGAYDMSSSRGTVAERASTTGSAAGGAAAMGTAKPDIGASRRTTGRDSDTIQVKEERLHAEKQPVEAGEVRVRKDVHAETKTLEVPVQREEVVIERTPVHGRTSPEGIAEDDISESDEIRIPVHEEKVRVGKDTVVTEEVKVGKQTVQNTEQVSGQVRKEEVKVEQKGDVDVRTHGGKGGSA